MLRPFGDNGEADRARAIVSGGVLNLSSENKASGRYRGRPAKMILRPNRSVIVATEHGVCELSFDQISTETVGQKAIGLLTVPASWTLPFFVVSDNALRCTSTKLKSLLDDASDRSGVKAD